MSSFREIMQSKGLLGGKYSNREDMPLEEEREVVEEPRGELEDIQKEEVPGKSKRKRIARSALFCSWRRRKSLTKNQPRRKWRHFPLALVS